MIQTLEVNNILKNIVKKGVCSSTNEAEKQLASKLSEMKLDRNIAEGRKNYKNGRYTTITDKNTKEFLNKLAKKLLPNQ